MNLIGSLIINRYYIFKYILLYFVRYYDKYEWVNK